MFWKKQNSSALELLKKHEQMLGHECLIHSQKLGTVTQSLEKDWQKKIIHEASFILSVNKGRETLKKTISEMKKNKVGAVESKGDFRYQISSLFLRDCWGYLKSDPSQNERLHFITGTVTEDGTKVLSRLEKVKYNSQSSAYVSADKTDAQQKIVSMTEDHGHPLLGVFHSHMSHGLFSTTPSSIDHSFMERMVKIGCHCLGGIFSLDGYVRFFMADKNFEIDVYGKDITIIEENSSSKIFKIGEGKNYERKNLQNKVCSAKKK